MTPVLLTCSGLYCCHDTCNAGLVCVSSQVQHLQQTGPILLFWLHCLRHLVWPAHVTDVLRVWSLWFVYWLQVQPLKNTGLILPDNYPSFTLIRQAVGAVKLGYEALSLMVPEVRLGLSLPWSMDSWNFPD
jgi:hypothetical protein